MDARIHDMLGLSVTIDNCLNSRYFCLINEGTIDIASPKKLSDKAFGNFARSPVDEETPLDYALDRGSPDEVVGPEFYGVPGLFIHDGERRYRTTDFRMSAPRKPLAILFNFIE